MLAEFIIPLTAAAWGRLAQTTAAPPPAAKVRLLMATLVVLILLLGALIIVTAIRRSLRIRREIEEHRRNPSPPESPWRAAGKRAKPITDDDDPDKTRPMQQDHP